MESNLKYEEILKSIDSVSRRLYVNEESYLLIIDNFYKNIFKQCFLEYIGITISENELCDFKCYFQPKGNVDIEKFYEYSGINDDYIQEILKEIKKDDNIKLLDVSFNNSISLNNVESCRFAFRMEKHYKEIAQKSMNHIVSLLGFEKCREWINSIAEIINNEINSHKYPFYISGFDYNLKNKIIDSLKVYFLGRGFSSPDANMNTGKYNNALSKNALARIGDFIGPELNKDRVIDLLNKMDSLGFNTKLVGINLDKEINWEFKVYFEIQETWDRDGCINLVQDNTNSVDCYKNEFVRNIFNIFEEERYGFEGLAITFSKKNKTNIKLYFRPHLIIN